MCVYVCDNDRNLSRIRWIDEDSFSGVLWSFGKLCIIQIELNIRSKGDVRLSLMFFNAWYCLFMVQDIIVNDSLEFLVLSNFSLTIFRKSDSILLYV